MTNEMIEVMTSLTAILEEETNLLRDHAGNSDLRQMAGMKNRLVGVLQRELATMERLDPNWASHLDDETYETVTHVLIALNEASAANRALLQRQLELTTEMIDALANEARKTSGRRASTYRPDGDLTPMDLSPPISINSHY